MREIKFRGRRTLLGKESFWIYGYGVIDNEILTLDYRQGIVGVECEKGTVGQYTGLKDKNGREIYEGDICKDALGFRFVVVWDDDARFLGRGIGAQKEYIRYVGQEPAVEVIGNIFDKPTGRER